MNSLGAVLEQFPDEVVMYITDPRTGIQRRSKWPPTISEVIEAGEDHALHLERLRKYRATIPNRLPEPLMRDRPAGYLAQVFVPEGHPRYAKLCEWAKDASPMWWKYGNASDGRQGLWVSHEAWNEPNKVMRSPKSGEGNGSI